MKIWLDDQINDFNCPDRHAPDGWIGCKTALSAIRLIKTGKVTEISFDHDLGGFFDGATVAKYIEKLAFFGKIQPIKWSIHSANPVGKMRIKMAMEFAMSMWTTRKK